MALRQLALNLQQEISTGSDLSSVRERLEDLSQSDLQELCSFRVDGRTLVATIAATNKWDLLDYLIQKGVKVHEVDQTILHFAVVQKADKVAKLLIENGIDVNHAREDGKTPLHVASEYGHTNMVSFLLENGAKDSMDKTERSGCTPLTLAAMTGQAATCSTLIDHGADINVKTGFPPLHAAALLGHSKIINLLLENGADVNLQDAAKALPIHYAAMKNHKGVVEELISRGSNLNKKDSRGNLPVKLAKSKEVLALLQGAMGLKPDESSPINGRIPSASRSVSSSNSIPNSPVKNTPPVAEDVAMASSSNEGKQDGLMDHSDNEGKRDSRPVSEPETGEVEPTKRDSAKESEPDEDRGVDGEDAESTTVQPPSDGHRGSDTDDELSLSDEGKDVKNKTTDAEPAGASPDDHTGTGDVESGEIVPSPAEEERKDSDNDEKEEEDVKIKEKKANKNSKKGKDRKKESGQTPKKESPKKENKSPKKEKSKKQKKEKTPKKYNVQEVQQSSEGLDGNAKTEGKKGKKSGCIIL